VGRLARIRREAWPRRVERYTLVPTICFNCEAACGLLAFVDRETLRVRKFEGNPLHPASRGRNCAKGPATINQIHDPERILFPLKRAGARGEGRWERVSWDQVLDEIGARIRKAFLDGRRNRMHGAARPQRAMDRAQGWASMATTPHQRRSSSARLGYALWSVRPPSPDHARALHPALSSHLEAGHYFNPHAQRIIDGKLAGAKLAVMDPRLSNTASMADFWLPTYPGSEAAVLLAMARVILDEGLADLDYVERWTNWREYMAHRRAGEEPTFAAFVAALKDEYREFTPEFAEAESGVDRHRNVEVARLIGAARGAFASHVWRGPPAATWGDGRSRAPAAATVLTSSVGTHGGTSPHGWNKYKPVFWEEPPGQKGWNELLFPKEWPLSHYEMSFLLPHFLKEGRGKLDVYFTRVYNPVWTNPDGMTWVEVLSDESLVGLHAALTPTWNETAIFADHGPLGMRASGTTSKARRRSRGWVSRQPVCAPRASGGARGSASPTRRIRARSGRRTSSGSS
jgi:anaerobic selenocysteine-containing dehydrogenase